MTKLITSLDQLEPGMKTKDGWVFNGRSPKNEEIINYSPGSFMPFECDEWYLEKEINGLDVTFSCGEKTANHLFLKEEVEVPE